MSIRRDSWYAEIPEEQLWKLYSVAKRSQWFEAVRIANEEMGLSIKPSRSGFYRWLDYMRGEESERRLAQARIATVEADRLAKEVGLDDDTAIRAYKSLAAELALKSNAKDAEKFLRMAMNLVDRQLDAKTVALKERDLTRKDEELKIAQEKLKIELAKNAKATETIKDTKLTPEQREAKLREIFGI